MLQRCAGMEIVEATKKKNGERAKGHKRLSGENPWGSFVKDSIPATIHFLY